MQLCVSDALAQLAKDLLRLSGHRFVTEACQMHARSLGQIAQQVIRAYPISAIGRIGNAVRQEQDVRQEWCSLGEVTVTSVGLALSAIAG